MPLRPEPVAVLLSADEHRALSGGGTRFWSALEDFRRTADLEALNADEPFEGLRDRSPGRQVAIEPAHTWPEGYVASFAGIPDDFARPDQGQVDRRESLKGSSCSRPTRGSTR